MKLAICTVSPPGYVHHAAFREVAETLHAAARELGHDAILTSRTDTPGYRSIILGSNLLLSHPQPLAPDAILYNLEQVQAGPWFNDKVLELFRRYELWDYSEVNAILLERCGLRRPTVVPIGWHPVLRRISEKPEDIDVLFYGCLNDRRSRILEQLKQRGVAVRTLFGVYGQERDDFIARSKIVLNMHYYEAKVFEIVRASYLLANGRLIVSERGALPAEELPFESGIAFAEYDQLVSRCMQLLEGPSERAIIAKNGRQIMESREATGFLGSALATPVQQSSGAGTTRNVPVIAIGEQLKKPVPTYYGWARPEVVSRVPAQGATILDVGCAAGAMGRALMSAGAREVVGLEVVPDAVLHARSRLTAVYQFDVNTSAELPYPDGYFDIFTCADVLEHLVDPEASMKHLLRWLKPGGKVICSIPNVRHESVLLPLLIDGSWNYVDAGILDRTHLRFFTLSSLQGFFHAVGLDLSRNVEAVQSPPSPCSEKVEELVGALGGNVAQFRTESRVIQYIVSAQKPGLAAGVCPQPLLDPWRGSKPHRLLIAPQLDDPNDSWHHVLRILAAPNAVEDTVTVGVAIPLAMLENPPQILIEIVAQNAMDLVFIEAPIEQSGWNRLLGGAHALVTTTPHHALKADALRLGVTVVDSSEIAH